MLRTVWGLDPEQLHGRFWQSLGVQTVRPGERKPLEADAELYLLLDPRSMPLFNLTQAVRHLSWVEPVVLTLRLIDSRDRGYRETVICANDESEGGTGEIQHPLADRFVKFRRIYAESEDRTARCALTPEREIAQLWQQAGDPLQGWKRIRKFIDPEDRSTLRRVPAAIYDGLDDADVAAMLRDLVVRWHRPHSTIPRARQLAELRRDRGPAATGAAWLDPTADAADAQFVGSVWVGAGRKLEAGRTVVGPAILWDDPQHRPADIGTVPFPSLEPDAPERAAAVPPVRSGVLAKLDEAAKRGFDITFALTAMLLTSPAWPVIMYAIWKIDGRPFFFGHRRQSLHGREFTCWKFRSMVNNSDEITARLIREGKNRADGAQVNIPEESDERITPIGRFLRRTNLDELPQFWNVLRGDMSVVGPRPSPDRENQFNPKWRELRLSVRPGITGLWQLRRTRQEDTDLQEWIKFDTEYVQTRSFFGDLGLVWRTFAMVIRKVMRS